MFFWKKSERRGVVIFNHTISRSLQQRPNLILHCKWQITPCFMFRTFAHILPFVLAPVMQVNKNYFQKMLPALPLCRCRPDQKFLNFAFKLCKLHSTCFEIMTLWQHVPNWWQTPDDNLNPSSFQLDPDLPLTNDSYYVAPGPKFL